MANHYGTARSNYFRVKDPDAFKAAMGAIPGLGVWERQIGGNGENVLYFGVYEDDGDASGFWPSNNHETDEEIDVFGIVASHLQEDQVAVFMRSGAEKMRYITGAATAVNAKGEQVSVDLDDIYELSRAEWGITPTTATY
jgi:hypothetical protein